MFLFHNKWWAARGVVMNEQKVKAVQSWTTPTMLKKKSVKEQHLLVFIMGVTMVVASVCTLQKSMQAPLYLNCCHSHTHTREGLLQPPKQIPLKWRSVKSSKMLIFSVLTDPCQISAPVMDEWLHLLAVCHVQVRANHHRKLQISHPCLPYHRLSLWWTECSS